MKIVVAPDSFKGSLTAEKICEITKKVANEVFEGSEVLEIPVADGGEGTVESVLKELKGEKVIIKAKNPLGDEIEAYYGIFNKENAIIEMATASGLPLIELSKRDIMNSSTYGTGELILDAINKGCKNIYIGIGGSATNDCGIGCAEALGVEFLDENNNKIKAVPNNFELIKDINISNINQELKNTSITIMCDVKNPLLGEIGATNVFGRQKGATEEQVELLEKGMTHIINLIEEKLNISVQNIEGAGAAGGLGAGLLAFTNSNMHSGVDTILEILDFKEKIKDADLVVTGEGMMDFQSAFGKVAYGVGQACKEYDIPCVAIVGGLGKNAEAMYEHGIDSMMTTVNGIMTLDDALENAEELCYSSVMRLFKSIKVGMKIKTR